MIHHEKGHENSGVRKFLDDNKKEDTFVYQGCQLIAYYLNPLIYITFAGFYFSYYISMFEYIQLA